MFSTQMILCSWAILSKLNVAVISSIKITEKLHGQCLWLLTVALGVVLNDHLKILELFMFVTGQYNLNLFVVRHNYFCKTVYSLSVFMCY